MSQLAVVFRTDASLDIGTGHVMRCLTLADALREQGASCRFVCRSHRGNLLDLIRQRGFEAYALPVSETDLVDEEEQGGDISPHAAWLGVDWMSDAQQTFEILGETRSDWLIVDHYGIDANWERYVRPVCRHLMVIDDLADRRHDCDLLVDQNLGRAVADYSILVPEGCTVYVGPEYALLRPEFSAARASSLARRLAPQLKHLLIAMGGVDKENATAKVLDVLKASGLPADCHITVVMGLHAPWLEAVRDKAAKMPWITEIRVNVRDMARLMTESDLAIGAAGTTAWERCCLGLPTLAMVLADNQKKGAMALERAGAVLLFENDGPIATNLHLKLRHLLSRDELKKMQHACSSITDGLGAIRIATELRHALH